MNKWQIICPLVAMWLFGSILYGIIYIPTARRTMVSAVTHQLSSHASRIVALLSERSTTNLAFVADAAFEELKSVPSTSLIPRRMIRVVVAPDENLECVIDTSALGLPAVTLRSAQSVLGTYPGRPNTHSLK